MARKMIRRSIFSMRSENVIVRALFVNRYRLIRLHHRLMSNAERVTSFLTSSQIRPFHAEDDLDGERDRSEADTDQDCAPHRRVQHVQDPLRQIAAERDQI